MTSRMNFSALYWIGNETPSFCPKCYMSCLILLKNEELYLRNLCTFVEMRQMYSKQRELRLAVQSYCLMEDDGWILYQHTATNRLKKCRFGFSAIFSPSPAAESRSQKPRDDRTLRTQRLWSDILMLLFLNHWDGQRRTCRYSKGELSFIFKQDIWDRTYQMF